MKVKTNNKQSNENNNLNIRALLESFEPKKENLIAMLHAVQHNHEYHYICEEAIREIAAYLNITPSDILGVISFYTMFSTKPRGKYIIRLCTSAPCHIMKAEHIKQAIQQTLGITLGETTIDNLFTLEASSCLGLCDMAPAIMINDEVYGDLTPTEVKKILKEKSQ